MCRCIDPGFSRRQRDAIQLRWIAFRLHRRFLRSRGWNRESNNNALSRTGSRFHSRRRKRRSSSKCVRTYIQLGSKSVTSRITSPIVRIQRPTQFESRVRRFQARLNRLQHASSQTILLSPTKSMSTVAQYPTTVEFTAVRQSEPDFEMKVCGGLPWNALLCGFLAWKCSFDKVPNAVSHEFVSRF